MTVVVHSFVADSSLLDCCDLVVCVFSTLCLQVGNRLGFWGGFSCFVSFIWCQLFACLIRAAIFRLPPLAFLSLPQAFVVCSFFLCHRHLCTVSFFHGLFCRRHSCVCRHSCYTFCLCLVSACFRVSVISQFLISCCALAARQLHPWRSELEFCPSRLPSGQPYKFHFEANPIWYFAMKFTKSHSAKCSLHKWAWLRRSIKVGSFEL